MKRSRVGAEVMSRVRQREGRRIEKGQQVRMIFQVLGNVRGTRTGDGTWFDKGNTGERLKMMSLNIECWAAGGNYLEEGHGTKFLWTKGAPGQGPG